MPICRVNSLTQHGQPLHFRSFMDYYTSKDYPDPREREYYNSLAIGQMWGARCALNAGFNPNTPDRYGVYPVIQAVKTKNLELLRLLIAAHADVNVVSPDGDTSLHLAVKSNNLEMVKTLIDAGADVNAKDKDGMTPAMLAAQLSASSILQLLISHHADLTAQDTNCNTALHHAVIASKYKNVSMLIDAGVDINAKNSHGLTPVLLTNRWGGDTTLRLLIAANADVNVVSPDGNTPLHLAVKSKNLEMVRTLIEAGANVNALNTHGHTPAMIAFNKSLYPTVKTLIEAGASFSFETATISPLVPSDVIRAIVPEDTPFWLAANNDAPMLAAELAGGLDPNMKTENGMTLLHWACAGDAPECVQLLLDAGANIKVVSNGNFLSNCELHPIIYARQQSPDSYHLLKNVDVEE